MKKIFALFSLGVLLIVLSACLHVQEADLVEVDGFHLRVYEECTVVKYVGDGGDLFVPAEYDGKPVTSVGAGAFRNNETVKSLVFPEGIASVGNHAFEGCIGLKSITLPPSIKAFGFGAFSGCNGLKTVNYDGNLSLWCEISFANESANPMWYAQNVYMNNRSYGKLQFPETVTTIGKFVFAGWKNPTEVTFHDNIAEIGEKAFLRCENLKKVVFGKGSKLGYAEETAFGDCPIETAVVPSFICPFVASPSLRQAEIICGDDVPENAFAGCKNLTACLLSDGIVSVRKGAFRGCTLLKSIDLPDSVTEIGEDAFLGCVSLGNVRLSGELDAIADHAFFGCKYLTSITIPASVEWVGEEAFGECYKLVEVCNNSRLVIEKGSETHGKIAFYAKEVYKGDYKSKLFETDEGFLLYGGERVSLIGYTGFDGDDVMRLDLPEEIDEIQTGAFFEEMNLLSVALPSRLVRIGADAFKGCLKLVEVCDRTILGVAVGSQENGMVGYYAKNVYGEEGKSKLYAEENGIILCGENDVAVVGYCGKERDLILPAEVDEVYPYVFSQSDRLESIVFSGRVKIGECAFYECSSLRSVDMSAGCGEIGKKAFYRCDRLEKVRLGENSKPSTIGDFAFSQCEKLLEIGIPSNVTTIGFAAFSGCLSLQKIDFGKQSRLENIGQSAFERCESAEEIALPGGVSEIAEGAFSQCKALKKVTLPQSLTKIGLYAFGECEKLTGVWYQGDAEEWYEIEFVGDRSNPLGYAHQLYIHDKPVTEVTFPRGVTEIKDYALEGWNGTSIVLPDTLIKIGRHAFANCKFLADINLPDGVQSIDEFAFAWCEGITEIRIPDSVTDIAPNAFYHCTKLSSVKLSKNIAVMQGFGGCIALNHIEIPDQVTTIGQKAFSQCKSLQSIRIPEGVSMIRADAFSGCTNLKAIDLPANVSRIESNAFHGCTGLTSFLLPDEVKYIDDKTFYACENLAAVTLSGKVNYIGSRVFGRCFKLKDVYFGGTMAQWNAIIKRDDVFAEQDLTLHCTDGNIVFVADDTINRQ